MTLHRSSQFPLSLNRLLFAFLLLIAALPIIPVQPVFASHSALAVATPFYAVYTVQTGDTLSAIARRNGSTVTELVSLNRLSNANRIRVGQMILVPAAVENRGSTISYTVRRGDTIYSLARRYDTTVGLLLWLNEMTNPNLIRIGQTLIVPGSVSPGTPSPTRIRFAAGSSSATVTGTISGGNRACYIFGAAAGQTATIQITSPGNLANFDFAPVDLAINGGFPFKRIVNEDRTFSQLLPATADYLICVATPSEPVSYTLTLTIPPLVAACTTPSAAIRSTDWDSVIASDPALTHELIGGETYVTVTGAATAVGGRPLTTMVVYGDFDDNCVEEAALPLDSGGTAGATGYLVYRAGSPTPQLIAWGDSYKLALSVNANRLVVTSALYAGWEPNCCPSGFAHDSYRLVGDVLTLVSHTTEGMPGMQTATVEQFYSNLNSHDFASAYALLSPTFQASNPFATWQAGYDNTVSFAVTVSADPAVSNRVQVTINAVESSAGGGTVNRTYVGYWDLIWSDGGWLLHQGVFHLG